MTRALKQFDLQAAMRGEPIITRAGEPVQFIAYVPGVDPGQQLVTQHRTGISLTGIDGKAFGRAPQSQDLFMAPCNKDAQHEIAALQSRVQELERMALTALRERGLYQISEPDNAGWRWGCY